jgi:hypothetical protein
MEDNKKQWLKPQLIVLDRGAPEERVLADCKYYKEDIMTGPIYIKYGNCDNDLTTCATCAAIGAS